MALGRRVKLAPLFSLRHNWAMLPEMAIDRRTVDEDGRMRIPGCKISKANVCPYYGREIPGYRELGLDANRIYRMYRDPEALKAAAATFEAVPLTVDHHMVTADAFPEDRIGGTVSNIRFEHPYLIGDVTAWTREAIDGIVSDERRELSCAYRYVASMMSGTSPDGVRYDGKMIGPIRANHVALVKEGRAGPDVLVADGVPRMSTIKTRFPKMLAAFTAALAALPQAESALTPALAAMDSALDEDLADAAKSAPCVADEFPSLSANERNTAMDNARAALGRKDLTEAEERAAYQAAALDKAAAHAAPPAPAVAADTQLAVDAAVAKAREGYITQAAADQLAADARAAATADVHALYAARADVADKVGEVVLDSAEAVYRFALDHLKIPNKDVPASALAALFAGVKGMPVVQDSAPGAVVTDVRDLFSLGATRRG